MCEDWREKMTSEGNGELASGGELYRKTVIFTWFEARQDSNDNDASHAPTFLQY